MQTPINRYYGLAIVVIGIIILINSLHIPAFVTRFVLPLIFAIIGFHFYKNNNRLLAGVSFGLALILFLKINIFGLIVALVFIYFGYQLLKKDKPEDAENHNQEEPFQSHTNAKNVKKSFIGEVHYTHGRFDLEDLTIQQGIGDVKIDLTKAIIRDGETVIIINGWIGDIDIYVPYDLNVSVDASVILGDLEVLGQREGGVNRNISMRSNEYDEATKKVKLILSLFIGDIDVRYL